MSLVSRLPFDLPSYWKVYRACSDGFRGRCIVKVTVRYFDGCPNWRILDRRLRRLAGELDLELSYEIVDTPDAAERVGFRGSPSLLVDGQDPFADGDGPVGLACRVYDTPEGPAGAPTVAQLRDVLGG